ncbi:DUF6286 domain-containing protein [Streptomyces sp. NPDC004647]|uniref:DUF6286 domain-containing protein n=1 Tax=Streptomyces sp. NPDC004647 TaxID=3154671 RepID=UPI0033A13076
MSGHEPGAKGGLPTAEAPEKGSPQQSASAAAYEGGEEHGSVRRFWSSRRVPAGIVAALAVAGTGLLLYDVAAVRAGRSAMGWRRSLAEELAERPLDSGWMIGGAAAAMVIGLWLLVLALTPGLRRLLPMRRPPVGRSGGAAEDAGGAEGTGETGKVDTRKAGDAGAAGAAHDTGAEDVRAGLHRSAAALVLRDRAMEVPGVQSVRVDVGRRAVRARAQAHFRDLDAVRADLDAALAAGMRELGLARQPSLSVHVRRPAKR